jgi:hypothetical protein
MSEPWKPTSFQPRSSATMKRMLGFSFAARAAPAIINEARADAAASDRYRLGRCLGFTATLLQSFPSGLGAEDGPAV